MSDTGAAADGATGNSTGAATGGAADDGAVRVPLDQVAADQREVIRAFRDAGELSYQDYASLAEGRASSEQASIANGLAPDEVAHVEDVQVGEFTVRVYDPREAGSAGTPAADAAGSGTAGDPVIAYAHGGGWVIGSLESHDPVCRRLATLTGLPVVAVDYRLAPEFTFPVPYTDCADALAWIRDNAAERGWSADRIIVAGDSAGGSISAGLAAVPALQVPGTTIAAQVLLYPSLDLAHETPDYERITAGFPLTAESVRWFAGQLLAGGGDANDPIASPLPYVTSLGADTPEFPPAFILALGLDPLGAEAVDYATLLTRRGTEVELVYLPHYSHGLVNTAGVVAMGEKVIAQAADFIVRHV